MNQQFLSTSVTKRNKKDEGTGISEDPPSTAGFKKSHQNSPLIIDRKNDTIIGLSSKAKKNREVDDYEDTSLFAVQISRSPRGQHSFNYRST